MDKDIARRHYGVRMRVEASSRGSIDYITSGPVVVLVVAGNQCRSR